MTQPRRPVLRYYGGKWLLAPWVIAHFPEHRVYVEPYGGAASVLMRKARCHAEVYNDIDGEIVNVFRVLRQAESAAALRARLELTPFARQELALAYQSCADSVERAARTIVKSCMGFGSDSIHKTMNGCAIASLPSGFRSDSRRSHTTPAHDWMNYSREIKHFTERLRGVVIENRDAVALMRQHDEPETLHYLDPPYVTQSRRDPSHGYTHEMNDADHVRMLEAVLELKGYVIISGYDSEIYRDRLAGWFADCRRHRPGFGDADKGSKEILWISPNIPPKQYSLFQKGGS